MIGLGGADGATGEFDQELAAYRRANELDPLWFRTVGVVAIAAAEMGDRAEAEAVARRGFPNNEIQQHVLLGRLAWILGDFSEAARHWSIVARSNSPRWRDTTRRSMNDALFAVRLRTEPGVAVPRPSDQRHLWRIWMDAPPAPPVWQARNRDLIAAEVYRDENHVAAKLMLNAGRTRELAAAYGSAVGLLGLRPGQPPRIDQLSETPVVALALRQAGRTAEADRLLREADAAVRATYRRGRVPFWFDADAAAIWAVQGRADEALAMLERAADRGWTHAGSTDLRNVNDEPAFRALHGLPRFERIRARLDAHYARERAETAQLQI
jgi:tetratricopeptide (TPR) repeat protein